MSAKVCKFACHKRTFCFVTIRKFYVYFHELIILNHLSISLPNGDVFSKVKTSFIESKYNICDNYSVNAEKIWINGDWFNSTEYGNFGDGGKNTKRSPLGNFTRWTITKSKKILKGIEMVSKYVRAYVYLVFTSQIHARSSIVGKHLQ